MRRLMLLRHAKSDWPSPAVADMARPLSPRGREAAPLMGRYIVQHALLPDRILVSPARRTRETWELAGGGFAGAPAAIVDERLYEAPGRKLLAVVQETGPQVQTLLLVGHNPGMQELAHLLIGAGDGAARQALAEKFPTGALAVIDFSADDWGGIGASSGRIDRFIAPKSLRPEG